MRYALFAALFAFPAFLPAQTGTPVPALAGLDQAITRYLAKAKTNGGALAVSQGGRLVYARGFGFADAVLKLPVQPDSLFRIGSISKPVTAVTALRLVEEGKLSLDAPVVPLLGADVLPPAAPVDARWNRITVRHLLSHSGGWDAEATFDPLTSYAVLEGLNLSLPLRQPLTVDQVIRFMAARPLQFEPGTRYAYSNFGMLLLGRVLERVTGAGYEKLVRDTVLEPLGIQRMALGGALTAQRRLGEVEYYDDTVLPAVYPGIGPEVPAPDGGYYFEVIQAAGAWIASPIDLVRFADGVDGRKGSALLRPETIRQMTARPSYAPADAYYGLGWVLERNGPSLDWLHDGAIEGTYALLYRSSLAGGVTFALTFNGLPQDETAPDELLTAIATTLLTVRQWPTGDAHDEYLPAANPRLSGVVNAASQTPWLAPDGFVSLYGLNLAGADVRFDGVPARVVYSSRNQLNALAPGGLRGRSTTRVEVVRNGASSGWTAPVRDAAPGIFTLSGNGRGALNDEQAPAARGSIVTLWGTGLDEAPRDFRLTIGGQNAELLYAGPAPGFPGVAQFNVRVPANAAPGQAAVELGVAADATGRPGVWLWIR